MRDQNCVGFLNAVLPTLGLRWSGYRKVHRTLCKSTPVGGAARQLTALVDFAGRGR